MFLEAHFGEVELHMPDEEDAQELEQGEDDQHDPSLIVRMDEADASINLLTLVCPISLSLIFVTCLIVVDYYNSHFYCAGCVRLERGFEEKS